MAMERIRRRRLPHWEVVGAAYFVTTCLEGSIPATGQLDIAKYRKSLEERERPKDTTKMDWTLHCRKLVFARMDRWLDLDPAVRHLSDPALAQIVVDGMFHFAGERYELLAFVVMPSHIHWVFRPLAAWVATIDESIRSARERILQSLNRHTSLECNKLLRLLGSFWQHESYDHWVRDSDELERIILYIENNPVKAGIVSSPDEFKFSSAWFRKTRGLEFGVPLLRA